MSSIQETKQLRKKEICRILPKWLLNMWLLKKGVKNENDIGWKTIHMYNFYENSKYDVEKFNSVVQDHRDRRIASGLGGNNRLEIFHQDTLVAMERFNANPLRISFN